MLSDHERRTLLQIQADLAASDPVFAQVFEASGLTPAPSGLRRAHLLWGIAAGVALLTLLSWAVGSITGAFFCAGVALGALVCQLRPHPGFDQLRKRRKR